MTIDNKYDVAVIGGGLSGLSLAIQLVKENKRVIVLEKETYPFHRVCGEYISLESWNFLEALGYPLSDMDLPLIKKLVVSSPGGNTLEQALPLGGFGISRYKIDAELALLARAGGAAVTEAVKVNDCIFNGESFDVHCTAFNIQAKVVAGSFGKRSNLDVKWKRPFADKKPGKLKTDLPADTIALHNFSNGYCGVSRIEDNRYCLCYLTTAANLRQSGNDIDTMEKNILYQNPWLKKIFTTAEFVWKEPVTIAQVSFDKKDKIENHVLMTGDAAGMITPLCGNGMSMAMHSSKIAAGLIVQFLDAAISRPQMEQAYKEQWQTMFAKRMKTGRWIQRMFGKPWITNQFIRVVKPFPKIISFLIRQTHGEPF